MWGGPRCRETFLHATNPLHRDGVSRHGTWVPNGTKPSSGMGFCAGCISRHRAPPHGTWVPNGMKPPRVNAPPPCGGGGSYAEALIQMLLYRSSYTEAPAHNVLYRGSDAEAPMQRLLYAEALMQRLLYAEAPMQITCNSYSFLSILSNS